MPENLLEEYERRARDVRALASQTKDVRQRRVIEGIADTWERLAAEQRRILATTREARTKAR